MISAGNDIVALNAINIHRTKQYGFYTKILATAEQELYNQHQHIPFEQYVWLLWSVKESVYKFLQRHDHNLIFSPSRIIISTICSAAMQSTIFQDNLMGIDFEQSFYSGKAIYRSTELYFNSIINADCIATVVHHQSDFTGVHWGIRLIDNASHELQSAAVRALVLDRLKSIYPDKEFQIVKSPGGCPILMNNGNEINIPISLAHHGHVVAYSLLIT